MLKGQKEFQMEAAIDGKSLKVCTLRSWVIQVPSTFPVEG